VLGQANAAVHGRATTKSGSESHRDNLPALIGGNWAINGDNRANQRMAKLTWLSIVLIIAWWNLAGMWDASVVYDSEVGTLQRPTNGGCLKLEHVVLHMRPYKYNWVSK
jgi:hypothetical protein